MSMTEAQQELHHAYKNLSRPELEGMLGDDEDTDLVINAILAGGKQVELKAGSSRDDESGDGREQTHHSYGVGQDGDADDDGGEETDDDAQSASGEAEGSDAGAGDESGAADDQAAQGEAGAEADTSALAPLDLAVAESRYQSALDTLKAEKATKLQQMLDGEIEPAEYSKYESEYEDKRDALKEQRQGEIEWMRQVHDFKAHALRESGINYDLDAEKGAAFDDWLKRLAANPSNGDKDEAWFLQQAHKKVCAEFEIAPKAEAPAKADPAKPAAPAKPPVRRADTSAIPPTLGGLPAASSADAGDGGEFAHIHNLTGMAYEKAIAALSPAARERFESE